MVLVFRNKRTITTFVGLILFILLPLQAQAAYAQSAVAEVVYGCTPASGTCVNVRLGPGTKYKAIKTARIGTVFEVNGSVVADGRLWYRIKQDTDLVHPERVFGTWYIAADFVRVHTTGGKEFVRSDVVPTGKYIIVDLSSQKLYAYAGKKLFLSASVSTGIKRTPTPKGTFTIFKKQPSRYMQGPLPGITEQYYDLPGVPWNLYFTHQGAAIHGAYWHSAFGKPHSNGCVNLPPATAKILYDWAPVGTTVIVRQ